MVTALLVFLSLIAALWLGLVLSPPHRAAYRDLLRAGDGEGTGEVTASDVPPVTLIAPARNEEAVLPKTVPSYCQQDYSNLRVVIVDDQSEDGTASVLDGLAAKSPNLTVVHGTPRPEGWLGKPWAVAQGVAAAKGISNLKSEIADGPPATPGPAKPWYCFTDSDCAFHPAAVRTAVAFARAKGVDMLTLVPWPEFGQACEIVGMSGLLTVLTMVFPFGAVNNPKSAVALAAGGFILIRREAYEKLGGHEAVRHFINEDVNLARKMKASGGTLHCRLTPDLVTTRMYEGWDDLWEGLTKNAYAGMDYQPRKFWVGLVVGPLIAVLPPVYLVATLWWALATHRPAAWAAFALSLLINVCMTLMHHRTVRYLRLPFYHTPLMPVTMGLYVVIATSSAFQHHFRGGNVWKGRRYDRATLVTTAE